VSIHLVAILEGSFAPHPCQGECAYKVLVETGVDRRIYNPCWNEEKIVNNASYAVSELPYIHTRTTTMAALVHDNSIMATPWNSSQRQRLASIDFIDFTSLRDGSFC
jgi:hypothetical protein